VEIKSSRIHNSAAKTRERVSVDALMWFISDITPFVFLHLSLSFTFSSQQIVTTYVFCMISAWYL